MQKNPSTGTSILQMQSPHGKLVAARAAAAACLLHWGRQRNCSYALICTSFDFLVYSALIHSDCCIIHLSSVFFLCRKAAAAAAAAAAAWSWASNENISQQCDRCNTFFNCLLSCLSFLSVFHFRVQRRQKVPLFPPSRPSE